MTIATVYHQTNRLHMFWEIDASEVVMADFERDAHVDIPVDMLVDEALEYVFEKTNSIHNNWYENVNGVRSLKGPTRSTSTGDIIMLNGQKYMVKSFGFKSI